MKMVAKKTARIGRARGAPPPDEMLDFPNRLKRAIVARDVTQKQLEARSGVSQAAISDLTREPLTSAVTAAVVARLAKALDVSLNYLLMGVGDTIPSLHRSQRQPAILDESTTPAVPALFGAELAPPARGGSKRR